MALKFLARPIPRLTRMADLILVAGCLLAAGSGIPSPLSAAAERKASAHPKDRTHQRDEDHALRVLVSARVLQPGAPFQVTVENHSSGPVYLPGCATYSLEKFGTEQFEPVAHTRCDWERAALTLPPGPRTFELTAPELPDESPNGWILRVTVAYGQGCLADRTLSTAQCKVLQSASSPLFFLREAADE